MYSFAQRSDTTVVDEPLYAHYLAHGAVGVEHPGEAEVLASQSSDAGKVIREVLMGRYERPVAVFKQMTHHLTEGLDLGFLEEMENVLLIRDPRAILSSYAKVISNPGIRDVGIRQQTELLEYLEQCGALSAVVDAKELLLDPSAVLGTLCERLGIPFDPSMLRWEAGPRPEDGVWAKYWYSAVHRSTGFQPYSAETDPLPVHLEELAEECRPFYEKLYRKAIKAR
ncbi:MAG: hypothetical protein IPJ00_11340 [Saprospirales bacterium]|nr:hypothetical protein [Saprospirales bacterium]